MSVFISDSAAFLALALVQYDASSPKVGPYRVTRPPYRVTRPPYRVTRPPYRVTRPPYRVT
ncbi:MAG: hypothetical protein HY300_03115 [Verrucomicrobia bacterium]|nr:hypothetical protein [Verrucomicrobiota bacterium]